MRILELYCGIGGCAAAVSGWADVVAAYDISRPALEIYRLNFPHSAQARTLESLSPLELARHEADLWWLSPPCQPYTRRGRQRDLDDPRSQSLLALLDVIARVRPCCLALENVPPFAQSETRVRLIDVLQRSGYEWREQLICPTELGVPARRRRYYLSASRRGLAPQRRRPAGLPSRSLCEYLNAAGERDEHLLVPAEVVDRYASAMHVVESSDAAAIAQCFTSAYGRSPVRSGSYVHTPRGPRYFAPREILRLLGFPDSFQLPPSVPPQRLWPLVGNSLSLPAVRHVLASVVAHGNFPTTCSPGDSL